MYCIYVWRPLMEASSTFQNIRPPVVSRWSRKVAESEYTVIFIIEVYVDNLEYS